VYEGRELREEREETARQRAECFFVPFADPRNLGVPEVFKIGDSFSGRKWVRLTDRFDRERTGEAQEWEMRPENPWRKPENS